MKLDLEQLGVSWEELVSFLIKKSFEFNFDKYTPSENIKLYLTARINSAWAYTISFEPHNMIDYVIMNHAPEEFIMEWKMRGWENINVDHNDDEYLHQRVLDIMSTHSFSNDVELLDNP